LLPALACLFAAMRISTRHAGRLLLVMAIVAALESLFGLLQVGTLDVAAFDALRNDRAFGTATGTFANRNHFAAFLAMTLPVLLGLLVAGNRPGVKVNAMPPRVASEGRAQSVLLYAIAVMMLVCLFFTRSRAGIVTSVAALSVAAIILFFARRREHATSPARWAIVFVLGVVAIAVLLAFAIGTAPIESSLDPERLQRSVGSRIATYIGTTRALLEFMPFGSGLSTFASVYPRFQLEGGTQYAGTFMNAAHNDYLQAMLELGIAGAAAIALALIAYAKRMFALASRNDGRRFTLLQLAAGAGMLPMLLHSLVDFPLHIPANAIWFATLAGVLFHRSGDARETAGE
jgi:O-antigen ligase